MGLPDFFHSQQSSVSLPAAKAESPARKGRKLTGCEQTKNTTKWTNTPVYSLRPGNREERQDNPSETPVHLRAQADADIRLRQLYRADADIRLRQLFIERMQTSAL
jgi:hypothetical protein